MNPSGIEPATFLLVAHCLNQLRLMNVRQRHLLIYITMITYMVIWIFFDSLCNNKLHINDASAKPVNIITTQSTRKHSHLTTQATSQMGSCICSLKAQCSLHDLVSCTCVSPSLQVQQDVRGFAVSGRFWLPTVYFQRVKALSFLCNTNNLFAALIKEAVGPKFFATKSPFWRHATWATNGTDAGFAY